MSSLSKRLRRGGRATYYPSDDLLLVLTCVDCEAQIAVPMSELRGDGYTAWLMEHGGWVLSARNSNHGAPEGKVLLGPLCRPCAQKGMDPALLAAADEAIGKKGAS